MFRFSVSPRLHLDGLPLGCVVNTRALRREKKDQLLSRVLGIAAAAGSAEAPDDR